jgi:hypothetical protein
MSPPDRPARADLDDANVGDGDPLDHADREVMTPAEPGTLADQRDLVDDDGDDIREYTGEPVETDEGWVVPETQNRGDTGEA